MIVDQFEALEATTKRTEKEELLEGSTALFRVLLIAALDPYETYHIQDIRLPTTPDNGGYPYQDDEASWFTFISLLNALHSRKITGNAAKRYVNEMLEDMPPLMRKWAARIVQKKLRCGVEAKTVNKVFPGMVPTFEVMLAKDIDCARDTKGNIEIREKIEFPVWVDRKLDGIRTIAIRDPEKVQLFSRKGHLIETLPTIEEAVMALPSDWYVLDGEVKGADWNETQSTVFATKNAVSDETMVYHIFDKLPLDVWKEQSKSKPYMERRDELFDPAWSNAHVKPVEGAFAHSYEQLLELFKKFLEQGDEGAMVKCLKAPYEFKRTPAMLKLKPKQTWEGRVVGHEFGKGKLKDVFGAFKIQIGDVVTSVGGGFSDTQRRDITADLEDNPKCYWGAIAEVEAQEMTPDGKLRFPVFKRFRNKADK